MIYILAPAIAITLAAILLFLFSRYKVHIKKSSYLYLLNFLLFIAGIGLIYTAASTYSQYRTMQHWITVKAEIIDAHVTGERAKMPEITYQYKIEGKIFTGKSNLTAPAFGNKRFRDQTARNILKEYKKGQEIEIHYNPENFAQSKVIVNIPWNMYMKYSLGILFLTLALSMTGNFLIRNKSLE